MIKDSETLLQFFKIRVTSQGHGPFAIAGMIFDHSNFIYIFAVDGVFTSRDCEEVACAEEDSS